MGASGSGKSTLMRAISGQLQLRPGGRAFNGRSLYANRDTLRKYVTYILQHDAFDEHLTIEENLDFAAASGRRISRAAASVFAASTESSPNWASTNGAATWWRSAQEDPSGGERKRLNIGLI
jgi:ABC-type multidrug transport system ATPase subunit